jgi:hypothetical protein
MSIPSAGCRVATKIEISQSNYGSQDQNNDEKRSSEASADFQIFEHGVSP